MAADTLKVTILPDGTLQIVTDRISPANHANAEQALAVIAKLAGGSTTREHRKDKAGHYHTHTHHEHEHQH